MLVKVVGWLGSVKCCGETLKGQFDSPRCEKYMKPPVSYLCVQPTSASQRSGSQCWRWSWRPGTFSTSHAGSSTRETASQTHTPSTSPCPPSRRTAGETCWPRCAPLCQAPHSHSLDREHLGIDVSKTLAKSRQGRTAAGF